MVVVAGLIEISPTYRKCPLLRYAHACGHSPILGWRLRRFYIASTSLHFFALAPPQPQVTYRFIIYLYTHTHTHTLHASPSSQEARSYGCFVLVNTKLTLKVL